jgi:hypothetical protein
MRNSSIATTSRSVASCSGAMRKADASAGLDQARGLQLRDGFAHDGAADAELGHEGGFGRQFVARQQPAVADAVAERLDEFVGQGAGAAAGSGGVHGPRYKPRRGAIDSESLDANIACVVRQLMTNNNRIVARTRKNNPFKPFQIALE